MPCRSDELIRNVIDLFRAEAAEQQIELRSSIEARIELDGVQTGAVRDALSNLVLNALQATPAGGKVTIDCATQERWIVFAVSDSGPGISPDVQAKIWEPFFTTRQRGTGLGLAIVRRRIEEAGGTAKLVSQNGGGARFELRLAVSEARP